MPRKGVMAGIRQLAVAAEVSEGAPPPAIGGRGRRPPSPSSAPSSHTFCQLPAMTAASPRDADVAGEPKRGMPRPARPEPTARAAAARPARARAAVPAAALMPRGLVVIAATEASRPGLEGVAARWRMVVAMCG